MPVAGDGFRDCPRVRLARAPCVAHCVRAVLVAVAREDAGEEQEQATADRSGHAHRSASYNRKIPEPRPGRRGHREPWIRHGQWATSIAAWTTRAAMTSSPPPVRPQCGSSTPRPAFPTCAGACGSPTQRASSACCTAAIRCASSQVGCAVRCPFCASGANGLGRSLTLAEMIEQVEAVQALGHTLARVTVSGVGEPLHNHHVVQEFVRACHARGLAPSLTTSGGPLPRLREWLHAPHNGLTISIHAGSETDARAWYRTDRRSNRCSRVARRSTAHDATPAAQDGARISRD